MSQPIIYILLQYATMTVTAIVVHDGRFVCIILYPTLYVYRVWVLTTLLTHDYNSVILLYARSISREPGV